MPKAIIARQPDGTVQLTFNIGKNIIQESFKKQLEIAAKEAKIPGFRKGKAPKKMVEEKINKEELYQKVIQELVPKAYLEAIKEHQLNPIITPKIELLKAKEGEDWQIRASTCEAPKIVLGNYKEEIRKALAPSKLWTPEKGEKMKGKEGSEKEASTEEKIQKVIEVLVRTAVSLPAIMVEDEINRSLASLISQVNSLGMTIDQYAQSAGKTTTQLREEYRARTESEIKLLFTLNEIAKKEKIRVTDQEIEALAKASGDEKLTKQLQDPFQKEHLRGIISRRKALEQLAKL
jgi:trigger factor